MALNFEELTCEIESAIDQIGRDFRRNKGLIHTEDDLKCLLFKRLSEIPNFQGTYPTMDGGISASMVHTELPWYDEGGKLNIKPDLTILDPAHLSILHGYYSVEPIERRPFSPLISNKKEEVFEEDTAQLWDLKSLPNKQFEFGGNAIIFELKFIRKPSGITERIYQDKILSDYKKIQRIFSLLEQKGRENDVLAYQVVFSKFGYKCPSFKQFLSKGRNNLRHRVIYKSIGLMPPKSRRTRQLP